jgi:tRNA(fMet)-specific endonuclease VapC
MASYLLDTNHLSPLVTLGHPLRERVLAQHNSGDEFSIPVPVLTEFLYGIRLAPRAAANLQEWELLQDRFGYYAVGVVDAKEAAELQVALRRTGWQLATVDALIATIAIRNNLILLTTDGDFRPISQLAQENWIQAQQP